MKNIKNFKIFETEDYESKSKEEQPLEDGKFVELVEAIGYLSDVLGDFEDLANNDDEESEVDITEDELEIIKAMSEHLEEIKNLKSKLVGEETEEVEEVLAESKKHPGFKKVASDIARKQGISKERASAILAAGSRKASSGAKMKNPRLKRVKG